MVVSPPTCAEGLIACGSACVDPVLDPFHCGGCGTACDLDRGCFAGACTRPAPLLEPRTGHGAALGSDGRIYVVGGVSYPDLLPSIEAYDPRSNEWTDNLDPLPKPLRRGLGMVARGDKLVALGGHLWPTCPELCSSESSKVVQGLAVADDNWSPLQEMPIGRSDAAVALTDDDHVLAIMGWTESIGNGPPLADLVVLDPNGDWSDVVALPPAVTPRWGARAVRAADGKVWVCGGDVDPFPLEGTPLVDVLVPSQHMTWEPGPPPMGESRALGGAALMSDDRIVYAGGVDSKGQPLASAEVFDPKTGSWAPFPSLPEPRFDTTAVALADGRIFLIGGSPTSPGAATDSVLVFDPRRDVWIE